MSPPCRPGRCCRWQCRWGRSPLPALRAALEAVRGQLWPQWELCIALDPAAPGPVARLLAAEAARDPRLRLARPPVTNPVALANAALGMARGAFVAILAPTGRLAEQALYEVAVAVAEAPDLAVLYADEDRLDAAGRRHAAWLKPEFDPDLLLGQDLLGGFVAYRRDLLRDARWPPRRAAGGDGRGRGA